MKNQEAFQFLKEVRDNIPPELHPETKARLEHRISLFQSAMDSGFEYSRFEAFEFLIGPMVEAGVLHQDHFKREAL